MARVPGGDGGTYEGSLSLDDNYMGTLGAASHSRASGPRYPIDSTLVELQEGPNSLRMTDEANQVKSDQPNGDLAETYYDS